MNEKKRLIRERNELLKTGIYSINSKIIEAIDRKIFKLNKKN